MKFNKHIRPKHFVIFSWLKYTVLKAMYALLEPPRALISAIYRLGDKLGPHQNQCMTTSTRMIRTKVW